VIRALICDLDDTIYPATTLPTQVVQPAFDAMVAANSGPRAIDAARLTQALTATRRQPFDEVVAQYALPAHLQRVWARACAVLEVTEPLLPYPDLDALRRLNLRRFLVTTGYERFQRSKVVALGIGSLFEAVHVDALDDPGQRSGKKHLFQHIMVAHGFSARDVAVVGDGLPEIRAGNELGLTTIQILREGVRRATEARYHIATFTELPLLLPQLDEA